MLFLENSVKVEPFSKILFILLKVLTLNAQLGTAGLFTAFAILIGGFPWLSTEKQNFWQCSATRSPTANRQQCTMRCCNF